MKISNLIIHMLQEYNAEGRTDKADWCRAYLSAILEGDQVDFEVEVFLILGEGSGVSNCQPQNLLDLLSQNLEAEDILPITKTTQ